MHRATTRYEQRNHWQWSKRSVTNTNEPYTSLFTLACYVRLVHIGRGCSLRIPAWHTDIRIYTYIHTYTYIYKYIYWLDVIHARSGKRNESLRHSPARAEMLRNLNIYWNLKVLLLGVFKSLPEQRGPGPGMNAKAHSPLLYRAPRSGEQHPVSRLSLPSFFFSVLRARGR